MVSKRVDQEILVDSKDFKAGDKVVVHMGTVIPFDGTVVMEKLW